MFPCRLMVFFWCLLLTSCGVMDGIRHSTHDETTQYSQASLIGPFHSLDGWSKAVPFYIHEDVPSYLHDGIISAADSWNESVGYDVLSYAGISSSDRGNDLYSTLDDKQTVVYYELNWEESTGKAASTLATTVWQNSDFSDEIVRGDIIMNGEMYMFQDATWSPILEGSISVIADCESIILHEFGHLLGLQHVEEDDDSESIMHAQTFIGYNVYERELSFQDVNNIRQIYPKDKF